MRDDADLDDLSFERSRKFAARELRLLAELARRATPALLRDAG